MTVKIVNTISESEEMIGKISINLINMQNFCNLYSYQFRSPLNHTDNKIGPHEVFITGIEPIDSASETDLSFCRFENEKADVWIGKSEAGCLILPFKYKDSEFLCSKKAYIFVEHPRLALLNLIKTFWVGVEEPADYLGAHSYIDPTAKLGPNVVIGRFCTIGANVEIGEGTIIGNNTTIMHAKIGNRCQIGSAVTIGGEGFGFEDDEGAVHTFPHIGGIIIGNDVRIGSSTCIDRASLGNTMIQDNVKIDNLVHIAHNVNIGRNSKVVAMSIIGGSTNIGENVWVAPGSSIRDWINIGDDVLIGMGAVVTKDVSNNEAIVGNPAKQIRKTGNRYR